MAGTTDIPENGMWWSDRTKMVGIVNHEHQNKKWESKYSNGFFNEIFQVCLVDGLFIAINKEKIQKNFNEEVSGFHFYDVTFCVENHLSDVKIGVIYDVRVTHKSIGVTNEKWEENRMEFAERFKSDLPIKFKPTINYGLINYNSDKEKYSLVIQTSDDILNIERIYSQLKKLNILQNLNISLISNDKNFEDLKKFESEGTKIFEGFFNTLNKNLSILKWDESFLEDKKDLIFFSNDKLEILTNVFSSVNNIYKKEKNLFGCVFPSAINSDNTIFSNGVDIFQSREQKIQLMLRHQFTYFNIFQGYYHHPFGNISDFFVTSLNNLKKFDWFDLNFDTNIFFLVFAIKLHMYNLKTFIDTNSLVLQDFTENQEKINDELRQVVGQIIQSEKLKNNIKILR